MELSVFNELSRVFNTHKITNDNVFNSDAYNSALIDIYNSELVDGFIHLDNPVSQRSGGSALYLNPEFKKTLIDAPIKVTINALYYYLIQNMNLETNFPIKRILSLVNDYRKECKLLLKENYPLDILSNLQLQAKAFLNATHGMFYNPNSCLQANGCYADAIKQVSDKIWNSLKFLYDDKNIIYINCDVCYINSQDLSYVNQWAEKLNLDIEIERPDYLIISANRIVTDLYIPKGVPFKVVINETPYMNN